MLLGNLFHNVGILSEKNYPIKLRLKYNVDTKK